MSLFDHGLIVVLEGPIVCAYPHLISRAYSSNGDKGSYVPLMLIDE